VEFPVQLIRRAESPVSRPYPYNQPQQDALELEAVDHALLIVFGLPTPGS